MMNTAAAVAAENDESVDDNDKSNDKADYNGGEGRGGGGCNH